MSSIVGIRKPTSQISTPRHRRRGIGERSGLLALAIALIFAFAGRLAFCGGAATVPTAFAAPGTISGKADIVITNKQQAYYEGVVAQCEATIHLPDGTVQVAHGHCISGGYYAVPYDGTYDYVGTLQPDGSYNIVIHSEVSEGANSDTFIPGTELGTQQMGGITIHYNPKTTIEFRKSASDPSLTEGNSAYSLAGAVYDIYDAATNKKVTSITTDEAGRATCTLERDKDYYAIETKAPQGYALNTERVSFRTSSATGEVSLTDKPAYARLQVKKIDACTGGETQRGTSLAGAEFSIESTSLAGWHQTMQTNTDGIAQIDSIPLGSLVVKETKAPKGYKLDPTPRTVMANSAGMNDAGVVELEPIAIANEISSFDVEIVKYLDTGSEGSGLQHAGAGIQFEIISNSTKKTVGTITTNEKGEASTADAKSVNAEAISDSDTYDSSKPWMGAGRRTKDMAGALPYDSKGYTLREVASTTPEGYRPCPDWTIEASQIADDATFHYIVDNDYVSSRIQVVKVDAVDGKTIPLAGFTFQLLDHNKKPITQEVWYPQHAELSEFTTDDSGTVTFPGALKPGTYYIREVAAPSPYLTSNKDLKVVISDKEIPDPVTVVRFEDHQATGIATIQKTCTEKECPSETNLQGAEFDIVAVEDIVSPTGTIQAKKDQVVDHVTTDKDGTAKTGKLPLGSGTATYACIETKAPSGHVVDRTPHTFTLSHEDAVEQIVYADVQVSNAPTDVTVVKTDSESGNKLAHATFALWDVQDQISIQPDQTGSIAVRTDRDDAVTMRYVAPYAVVTTRLPEGVSISLARPGAEPLAIDGERAEIPAGTYTVHCSKDGKPLSATESSAEMKADSSYCITVSQSLLGNRIEVEESAGAEEPVTLHYSDTDQAHVAHGLKAGTYELTVNGTVCDTITLGNGATYLTIEEEKACRQPILLTNDAKPVTRATSKDGVFNVKHLAPGSYRLREVAAPQGYIVNDEIFSFDIDQDGLIDGKTAHEIIAENDFTKVEISKVDAESNAVLPGAKLSLKDEQGKEIDTWTSSEKAHLITHIEPGRYSVVEAETPQGHDQADPLEIEVRDIPSIQRFALYDTPISIDGSIDKRQQIADPVANEVVANNEGVNRAETTISEDGSYVYTLDFQNESSTWVDEFTVTDQLDGAKEGLAVLTGVATPQVGGDYDGALNIWLQTNLTSADYVDPSKANATKDDGHENPWLTRTETQECLGDDGRRVSYDGWRLWKQGVSAKKSQQLNVQDLDLADNETVTAVRFEFGRVEAGFTTRNDLWDRDDLKDPHDDFAGNEDGASNKAEADDAGKAVNENTPSSLKGAVLHMRVTDAYVDGLDLNNSASIELYRNGGGTGLEARDTDFVTQSPVRVSKVLPQTSTPSMTGILLTAAGISSAMAVAVGIARRVNRARRRTRS